MIPSDIPHISVDLSTLKQVAVHNGKLLGKTAARGMATTNKLQLKLDNVMQSLCKILPNGSISHHSVYQ